jgi:hypothetical protein
MLLGEDGQHGSILQLCLARGMAPTLGMTLLLVGPGCLFAETVSNMYKISSGVLTIHLSILLVNSLFPTNPKTSTSVYFGRSNPIFLYFGWLDFQRIIAYIDTCIIYIYINLYIPNK